MAAWRTTAVASVFVAIVAIGVAVVAVASGESGSNLADGEKSPQLATSLPAAASSTTLLEKPIGWGAEQPPLMYAEVEFGQRAEGVTVAEHEEFRGQMERARAAALAIDTVEEAERLGYERNGVRVDGRGYEYLLWDQFDEFDIDKPTMLVFPETDPQSRVISIAYQAFGTEESGPPAAFNLSLVPWHRHDSMCEKDGEIVGANKPDRCAELEGTIRPELEHWMVDFWVIPGWENPWGLVSSAHPSMYEEPTPWFDREAALAHH